MTPSPEESLYYSDATPFANNDELYFWKANVEKTEHEVIAARTSQAMVDDTDQHTPVVKEIEPLTKIQEPGARAHVLVHFFRPEKMKEVNGLNQEEAA